MSHCTIVLGPFSLQTKVELVAGLNCSGSCRLNTTDVVAAPSSGIPQTTLRLYNIDTFEIKFQCEMYYGFDEYLIGVT